VGCLKKRVLYIFQIHILEIILVFSQRFWEGYPILFRVYRSHLNEIDSPDEQLVLCMVAPCHTFTYNFHTPQEQPVGATRGQVSCHTSTWTSGAGDQTADLQIEA